MAEASFSPWRAYPASEVPNWDLETDVAIVGFGGAGASAAIEAATAGMAVTLFEVSAGSGGASGLSGGDVYLGGNGGTPIQRAAGFEDSTEDLYNYLLAAGGPDADEARVRLYADNALGHYHWLVEQGVPFKGTYLPQKITEPMTDDTLIWSGSEEAWPFSALAKPAPRGHSVQMMGAGAGRKLMDALDARVQALGVDVRCNSRVLCLVVDLQNRVCGLVVRIDSEARFVRVRRGVILCAGGFCMNKDMLRRHAPQTLTLNMPIGTTDDGSGILMGMSVGGDAIHMDEFFVSCGWYPPDSLVKGIFVNEKGQRFINEDCYHGRVIREALRQPGDKVYLLVDNAIFDRPVEDALITLGAAGESWDEVERELGMPEGTLTATVSVFNRHAAEGLDPLFNKAAKWLKPLDEGPFAAFELERSYTTHYFFTLGGLKTLPTGEVLDRNGAPIAGLYAAGRTACGLPRWGDGYSSGMSLGDSTFFGRQAGKSVARAGS
jgi:succinate dehydrogenase/fumarate reductase flavoprotein subunit